MYVWGNCVSRYYDLISPNLTFYGIRDINFYKISHTFLDGTPSTLLKKKSTPLSDSLHTTITSIICSHITCLSQVTPLHWASPGPRGKSPNDSLSDSYCEFSPVVWPLFHFLVLPPLDDHSPLFLTHPLPVVTLRPISTQIANNNIVIRTFVNRPKTNSLDSFKIRALWFVIFLGGTNL